MPSGSSINTASAPRQVKLRQCSVFSPTFERNAVNQSQRAAIQTRGIDISKNVMAIDIYESIFQNTISGSLTIRETEGYIETLPLTGTEHIYLEFAIDYLNETRVFNRVFRIRRIGDVTFPKNEERMYTIDLVTPEFLRSVSTRVLKKYNNISCMDAVKDIMKTYLKVPEKKMQETHFENTDGVVSVVIPNYTPLQAINFFSTLALTKKIPSESNFLFFETIDGFYFTSARKLIEDAAALPEANLSASATAQTGNTIPIYEVNANKMTGMPSIAEQQAFNSIIRLHQDQTFDVLVDTASGLLRSKMLHLDFFARKWNEEDSRYTETFKKTTHLDKYPVYPNNFDQSVGRNVKMFIVPTNISSANSKYVETVGDIPSPQRMYESIVLRNRQLKELQHLKTLLDVPGRADLRAGKVIVLRYPSSRALSDANDNPSMSSTQLPTPYHSGRHLVTSVRHTMTQVSTGIMEYRMHIEAVRDSFGAPLIGYKEDANDKDGKAV